MKKIAILLTLCMFILVGCNGNTEPAKVKLTADEMGQVFEDKYQELLDAGIECELLTDEFNKDKGLLFYFGKGKIDRIDDEFSTGAIDLTVEHVYEDNSVNLTIHGGYIVSYSYETLEISKMYVKTNDNTVKFDDMILSYYNTAGDLQAELAEKTIDTDENIESLINIFTQSEDVRVRLENSDSTNQFDITFPKEINKNMLAILEFYKELKADYDI